MQAGCERLEQHNGRSASSRLRLEPLLLSSVSSLVYSVALLVSGNVAARCERLMSAAISASDALSWDSQPIQELLYAAEQGLNIYR